MRKRKPRKLSPETAIKKTIKEYLFWRGWFYYHNLQGLGCYAGLSDIVAMKDGQVVYIEVKAPNGNQTEKQKKFQRNVEKSGCKYIIARSVDDLEKEGM